MRRSALKLGLSLAVGLFLLELLLRFTLFSDCAPARWLGAHTRRPQLYADPLSDDDYWLLDRSFRGDWQRRVTAPDPILGWRGSSRIRASTYEHQGEAELGGRQPILLFGDSFAQCTTPPEDCFGGLFARGPRAAEALLLNYGVGGYGVDQIYLMLREVLRHWDGRRVGPRPIAIVSIMVDGDLDRCVLSVRDWPKPRFRLVGDELILQPPQLSPDGTPQVSQIGIASYLWNYLLHGAPLPERLRSELRGAQALTEEKRALNARLVREMQVELDARGLEYFFLLFPGHGALASAEPWGWQEPLLLETFRELGVRHVNAKRDLRRDMQRRGLAPQDYFGRDGQALGHYTAEANAIALEAIYRGLDGADDGVP